MSEIIEVRGFKPKIGEGTFLASGSKIIGDVVIGTHCSIWFNAVVRGDVNSIVIGNNSNIQDGVTIHCTYQGASTKIGNQVSIGHNAIIHGCTIHDGVLIGMGAIIMDNAIVESGAMVAAGAVVLEGTICKSGYIYAGAPAKIVKELTTEQADKFKNVSGKYLMYKEWFKQ